MVARKLRPREHDLSVITLDPARIFDRALLAQRRARVAGAAADHDFLLARVADDLAERLAIVRRSFPLAANIGAHHGLVSRRIRGLTSVERIIDVDSTAVRLDANLHIVVDHPFDGYEYLHPTKPSRT